jgi:hypothetical protein
VHAQRSSRVVDLLEALGAWMRRRAVVASSSPRPRAGRRERVGTGASAASTVATAFCTCHVATVLVAG